MSATPLAVTVSARTSPALAARARAKATEWGLPYFERSHRRGLSGNVGVEADSFLVLGGAGWTLRDASGELRFTPGMAMLRIKRFDAGVRDDVLLNLAELKPGDTVLDATLGLGADALVCARALGPTGRVIGVERSQALALLVSEGLAAAEQTFPGSAPIEVRPKGAMEVLSALPRGSVDCVTFDPMFDRPKRSTPPFELLRRHASHEPLTQELLQEARRVARRWVVVKAARFGQRFKELGLIAEPTSRFSPVMWARLGPA